MEAIAPASSSEDDSESDSDSDSDSSDSEENTSSEEDGNEGKKVDMQVDNLGTADKVRCFSYLTYCAERQFFVIAAQIKK
jgi:hypothetical protein